VVLEFGVSPARLCLRNEDYSNRPASSPFLVFCSFPVLQREMRFVYCSFPVSFPLVSRFLPIGRKVETNMLGKGVLPPVLLQPSGFDSLPGPFAHCALTDTHFARDILGAC
jgi:hypothetical protein